MERTFLSGKTCKWSDSLHIGLSITFCLLIPCSSIRKVGLLPIAVILSLPIAGVGAYLGNWICGLENNVYFQIGLVMLVGLVAKNAIRIVEFAKDEVEKGNNAVDARNQSRTLTIPTYRNDLFGLYLRYVTSCLCQRSGIGQSSRYRYRRIFRYDCGNYRRHYFCSPSFRMGLQVKI